MKTVIRSGAALALLATMSSCGGDGTVSGGGGTTSPTNQAPVFISAGTASVAENFAGTVYQAAATDADGDALTYAIAGGADGAKFAISGAGALTFVAAPNYDLAADADGDNVYQVQLSASDGKTATTLNLALTVTNLKEGVAVHRVAIGFDTPTAIAPVSDTIVLVGDKSGAIYQLNPQTGARTLLIRPAQVDGMGIVAIGGTATFAADGTFFAMYTTSNGALVASRFLRNPAGPTVQDNFGPLFGEVAPNYPGGGWIGYDGTGTLLFATSDAGGIGDPTGSAQNPATRLGKIIRAAVNPDPYAGVSPVFFLLSTIAQGLHYPTGGTVMVGGLVFADRGETTAEELDLLTPDAGVRNFGWPAKEGTRTVRGTPAADATDPVAEYLHGAGSRAGQAIVGGAPGPAAIASLANLYVFGDTNGAIFAVPRSSIRAGSFAAASMFERRDADFVPDLGAIDHPVAIAATPGGTLFILDSDGEVFRVDAG